MSEYYATTEVRLKVEADSEDQATTLIAMAVGGIDGAESLGVTVAGIDIRCITEETL